MSDLSPEARAFLDVVDSADDPVSADRERVGRALAASLGIAALAPSAAHAGAVAVASTTAVSALKVVAVAVVLAAIGAGAVVRRRLVVPSGSPPAHVGPHGHVPRAVVRAGAVVAQPVQVAVVAPAPPLVVAPAAARAAHAAEVPVDSLLGEIALLGEAHRATLAGDADRALTLLATYRERFPRGELRQERDVERILALCRAGRTDEARAAASGFLRAHPGSPLAPRVEASCARSIPPGDR